MMKSFTALALAGTALAQSCSESRDGTFNIQITNVTSSAAKRSLSARQLDGTLTVTLQDGVLKDQADRTGNVVANHQFQFDSPIQDGSLYQSGFAVCPNGTLTHQGSAIWYQCLSGTFYNLYDESQGEQCNPVYFSAVGGSNAPVSQSPDGQPAAPTGNPVSQIEDGQPQASTGTPAPVVSQIPDGQPQGPTDVPAPAPAPTGPVVSQIPDGQPQGPTDVPAPAPAPTGPVVSQINDGQPQAPTDVPAPAPAPSGPVVSQINDGQPQAPTDVAPAPAPAPTGPVVSQINDGQPQAPTGVPAPAPAPPGPVVSQIADGQPQAPTTLVPSPTGPVVSQIADGQPQAPVATGNITSPNITAPDSAAQFPGSAPQHLAGAGALAAAVFAVVALL